MPRQGSVYWGIPVLFFVCAIALFHCNDTIRTSPTDVVTITDVNSAITENDVKAGVQKTNNFMPSVQMPHEEHESHGIKCVQCHHTKNNNARIKQCAACHKGEKGRDQMHNFCIDCHVKVSHGPTQCRQCHKN